MKKENEKHIDAMKERMLLGFLKSLDDIAFVKSTNSVTGEEKILVPVIEDQEAIIRICGEFDREDLKNLIASWVG